MSGKNSHEDHDFNNEFIRWAKHCLLSERYTLKNERPTLVKNSPWSYVVVFETTAGKIYLKHMPKQLALEADIIHLLHNKFNAPVPSIIAKNPSLHCFLMKDAGLSLREVLKQQFNINLIAKTLEQFISLQLAVANHSNIFFELGVPDWRLNNIPHLFEQVLLKKELLLLDGLLESEITQLQSLLPKINVYCETLLNYAIPQTLVQPDFNDNNNLIDLKQNITLIDLGEIVITHPFFSLINFVEQIKKHHSVSTQHNVYQILIDECLNKYSSFNTKENLVAAWKACYQLWFVYEALGQLRLIQACDQEKIMQFQRGKLSFSLREVLKLI